MLRRWLGMMISILIGFYIFFFALFYFFQLDFGIKTSELQTVPLVYYPLWLISPDASCSNMTNGWDCTFKTEDAAKEYAEKCAADGGVWVCYGFCVPSYTHYCYLTPDFGETCERSSDCAYQCLANTSGMDGNVEDIQKQLDSICSTVGCEGKCSAYNHTMCDSPWFEINDNKATQGEFAFCD